MANPFQQLAGASAGPEGRPTMLSVGDSLMWGQGMAPENRFREIVRRRVSVERQHGEIVELSMARSGAVLHPDTYPEKNYASLDAAHRFVTDEGFIGFHPNYRPHDFSREVPNKALSTFEQLRQAEAVLRQPVFPNGVPTGSPHPPNNTNAETYGDPAEIELILLDGGINDVTVEGLLTPFLAYSQGYVLATWRNWILDQCKKVEESMVKTLEEAIRLFPNATIVVNGYFPIFSHASATHLLKVKSVGVLHSLLNNLIFSFPLYFDSMVSASSAWQAASNFHLRRAIHRVHAEHPKRRILFARSNIEGIHALFGPESWLWGYQSLPSWTPGNSVSEWSQWLAGANPEDQVIKERINRCDATEQDGFGGIACRLASIGHPNMGGSLDYARSIIEVLEESGFLTSTAHRCATGARRRHRNCTQFFDSWAYRCVTVDAAIGQGCDKSITSTANATANLFVETGRRFAGAGQNLADTVTCFAQTGEGLNQCNETAAQEMAACQDAHTQRVNTQCTHTCTSFADCDDAHTRRLNTSCDIRCNSFENCDGRYGRFNPLRYTCRASRAACVAAAAVARGACVAGSLATLAACKTARLACEAGAAAARTACITGSLAQREACRAAAYTRKLACQAKQVGGDILCAAGRVVQAVGNVLVGIGTAIAGAATAVATGVLFAGCKITTWVANRACRLGNWVVNKGCNIGNVGISIGCWIGAGATRLGRAITGLFNSSAKPEMRKG